jgi:phosphoserine phosphatase
MRAMHFVLTLIGAPGSSTLDMPALDGALAALGESGAAHGAPDWLDPGVACDVPFDSTMPQSAEVAVREHLARAPVDIAVQPAEGRRKALLVADMESTIIAEELLDEMADTIGIRPEIAAITARSMAGELDFEVAIKERVRLLAGLPVAVLDHLRERMTLNPGARTLVQTMRAAGAYTVLVSGGFTHFTEVVRARCGFDEAHGNRLIVTDGALSGKIGAPILGPTSKQAILEGLCTAHGLELREACAVGDGANDVAMVTAAGLGVAYRAKSILRHAAPVKIEHGDLTALLYLQGYRRDELRA